MMRQLLKLILTTTCFTLVSIPLFASEDEGSGGMDLSSLLGGSQQEQGPKISSFLLQQIPTDSMSESTNTLTQIFGTGGKFSYDWYAGNRVLTVRIDYNPKGAITSAMESFRSIEDSLASTIATATQHYFFPEGDNSVTSRAKRAREVSRQISELEALSHPKKSEFYKKHPELFGPDGVDQYIKDNLAGAFTAGRRFTEEESSLDHVLLENLIESEAPTTFTYAFPRTDGILSDKDARKEKSFGNHSRNYVAQQNNLGTVSFTFTSSTPTEAPDLDNRRITSETGLSDVIGDFESLVIQALNGFMTAATMKAGASSTSSGMYH